MTSPNDGGPAFPSETQLAGCGGDGMTLRDYFAAQVATSLPMPYRADDPEDTAEKARAVAQVAYAVADALIEEGQKC
jgi:hypothetical protein